MNFQLCSSTSLKHRFGFFKTVRSSVCLDCWNKLRCLSSVMKQWCVLRNRTTLCAGFWRGNDAFANAKLHSWLREEPSLTGLHVLVSSWIVASQLLQPALAELDHRQKKKTWNFHWLTAQIRNKADHNDAFPSSWFRPTLLKVNYSCADGSFRLILS